MATLKSLMDNARALVPEVSAEEAKAKMDRGEYALVLDVREPQEWNAGHIPGAVHIPRGLLEFKAAPDAPAADARLFANKDSAILVHCAAGARSLLAAQALRDLGYADVASMSGGFHEWEQRGYPTEQ